VGRGGREHAPGPQAPKPASAVSRYRWYVLAALTTAFGLNFLDRNLLGVLNEPIRKSFGLSDLQMGILGGPAFALLYTFVGLPIGRLSERCDRRAIIALALVVWSGFTALCGSAGALPAPAHIALFVILLTPLAALFIAQRLWVGALLIAVAAAVALAALLPLARVGLLPFGLLLLARLGVGIGEAGCYPPANSIIADYFGPDRRASALSIFSAGAPVGAILAALLGAWLSVRLGWRGAFSVLSIPGFLVAAAVFLTVKEPQRPPGDAPSFIETLAHLGRQSCFRHLASGAAVASFVGYGSGQFLFAFLSRVHHLAPTSAAPLVAFSSGIVSTLGIASGGHICDRLSRRIPSALALVPGACLVAAAPLFALSFLAPNTLAFVALYSMATLLISLYVGPTSAIAQALATPKMRATAVAVLAFIIALVGSGLGPPVVGWLSDILAAQAPGGLAAGKAAGLRYALAFCAIGYVWAGAHFLLAARTFVSEMPADHSRTARR
jgi:MFS family permease